MGKEVCIVKKSVSARCRAGGGADPDAFHLARRARGKRRFFYLFRGNDLPLSRAYGDPNPCGSARDIARALRLAAIACAFPYG